MSIQLKAARYGSQGGIRGQVRSGDPGLLGGILGGIGGFLTGGPVGAVTGAVSGWRGTPKPQAKPTPVLNVTGMPQGPGVSSRFPVVKKPGVRGAVERMLPGGSTGYEVVAQTNGKAPGGYHWNKSDYFLRDGTFIPKGTKLVKNRRRNALNPRAASRAMSRLESAKRAVKDLSRVTIRKKQSCGCR